MSTEWKRLNNPPVVAAIFQIKYERGCINVEDFLRYDSVVRKKLKVRADNMQSTFTVPKSTNISLGKVQINGTQETHKIGFTYLSSDQKVKLSLAEDGITFTSEERYTGWEHFKSSALDFLDIYAPILSEHTILRTSIRFVNQFTFKDFEDPAEYFNTVISSASQTNPVPYPLLKYGFRLTLDVEEGVYSIVNQNVNSIAGRYVCVFDIDVLNRNNIIFDKSSISDVLEHLRNVKNNIFFNNLTDKTLNLCN